MEAISHAGICVGILAKDGIVLAVEKKITSKLLENISSEKMYKVKGISIRIFDMLRTTYFELHMCRLMTTLLALSLGLLLMPTS